MTHVQSYLRSPMAGRARRSLSWCMAPSSPTSATLATRWWAPASSCASGTSPGVRTCPRARGVSVPAPHAFPNAAYKPLSWILIQTLAVISW